MTSVQSELAREVPEPGDFKGRCLVGECTFDAELLLPDSTYFGLPKAASYLYGTWRDEQGHLLRALRGVGGTESEFAYMFDTLGGGQLACDDIATSALFRGNISTSRLADEVTFAAADKGTLFHFGHHERSCEWSEGETLSVSGEQFAPGIQWYNSWPKGGCFSATAKYRSEGQILGRRVQGFIGHEIHYFPPGVSWIDSPYGQGREICWQQIANEYDDGSLEQATFAVGRDGWGFALVHDRNGNFVASTDVTANAEVRENGYPTRITYRFDDEAWTWRIDPQGERARTIPQAPLGADGACVREDETRRVVLAMGNSDWWTDGRAAPLLARPAGTTIS